MYKKKKKKKLIPGLHIGLGGDRTVLLNLYRSLIRSKLDYGSIVYGSARKSYLKSLDTIHHQGLRLALGAFRTSPVESLYAESNEPSLYIRREKLSLQYVTKLAANPRNSAYDCVFNPKYERFYNNKPTAIKPLGLRIQPLLEEANINIKNVQHFSFPSKEPWTLNPPKIIIAPACSRVRYRRPIFLPSVRPSVRPSVCQHLCRRSTFMSKLVF